MLDFLWDVGVFFIWVFGGDGGGVLFCFSISDLKNKLQAKQSLSVNVVGQSINDILILKILTDLQFT